MGSSSSKQPLSPHQWRAKLGGKRTGPLSEMMVRKLLAHQSLRDDVWFQKGESPYRTAEEVRELFEVLDRDGLYLKHRDTVEGPYTPERMLKRLAEAGEQSLDWLGRRGKDGPWLEISKFQREFGAWETDAATIECSGAGNHFADDENKDVSGEGAMSTTSFSAFAPSALETILLGDEKNDIDAEEAARHQKRLDDQPMRKATDLRSLSLDEELVAKKDTDSELCPRFEHKTNVGGFQGGIQAEANSGRATSSGEKADRNAPDGAGANAVDEPRRRKIRTGGKRGLLCLDCGKTINLQTGVCDHCRVEMEREEAELAGVQQVVPEKNRQDNISKRDDDPFQLHQLAKLVALLAAFATSGVFASKGLVSAILWRPLHSGQQQVFGWGAFVLSGVLAGTALFTIRREFGERQHDKLKKFGGVSLLVASAISYFVFSDRFRSMNAELDEQMLMWTKMMESGGYQQEILNEDREDPLPSAEESSQDDSGV